MKSAVIAIKWIWNVSLLVLLVWWLWGFGSKLWANLPFNDPNYPPKHFPYWLRMASISLVILLGAASLISLSILFQGRHSLGVRITWIALAIAVALVQIAHIQTIMGSVTFSDFMGGEFTFLLIPFILAGVIPAMIGRGYFTTIRRISSADYLISRPHLGRLLQGFLLTGVCFVYIITFGRILMIFVNSSFR